MDTDKLLQSIIDIVHDASKIMMNRDFVVRDKGDVSNLVTSSDIAVQKELERKLTALLPGSVFLGEEGIVPDTDAEYVWVVDPIDGTANFARDMGLSVISVALLKYHEQFIGVIYQPYKDETYYAVRGGGAFMNGKPIHVSDRDFRSSLLFSATCLYDKSLAHPCFEIIERVYAEADDLRRLGAAALELCQVAVGRGELYFEIRLSCWDYAAGTLIIREAGGFVEIMFEDGVNYRKPAGVFAANTYENFERLKKIIYDVIKEPLY